MLEDSNAFEEHEQRKPAAYKQVKNFLKLCSTEELRSWILEKFGSYIAKYCTIRYTHIKSLHEIHVCTFQLLILYVTAFTNNTVCNMSILDEVNC